MIKSVFVIFLSLFACSTVFAEFDYQSYQSTNYQEVKQRHTDDMLSASKKSDYVVSAATFKYHFPLAFIKQLRKLSDKNKTVLHAWQKALRVPDSFVELYQHEFKVEFNGEIFWIPVQEHLLLPMSSELHPGDNFELYVVLIGAIDNKLVMLATEFISDRAPE